MCSTFLPRSSTRVFKPFSHSSLAAQPPLMPLPITMASYWMFSMVQPEIDRSLRCRVERQGNLAAGARRFVGRKNHLEHGSAVLAAHQRTAVVLHTVDEVGHLGMEAVIPGLFIHGEAPAHRRAGLFHRVAIPGGAERLEGI